MKYTLTGILIILSFLITNKVLSEANAEHYIAEVATTTPAKAPKIIYNKSKPTEGQLALINKVSEKYGVSKDVIIHIVSNESDFKENAVGDSNYVCPKGPNKGLVAPSHGAVQISSCWHPEVTLEQANDFEFSVEFLARGLANGKCGEWSTCPI